MSIKIAYKNLVADKAYKTAVELGLRYCEALEIKEAILNGDASDFISAYEFVGRQWLEQERAELADCNDQFPYCITTEFAQYVCFAEQAGIIDTKHFLYKGFCALDKVSI